MAAPRRGSTRHSCYFITAWATVSNRTAYKGSCQSVIAGSADIQSNPTPLYFRLR